MGKLYVGNIDYSVDETELMKQFASYGAKSVKIGRDGAGKSCGYAFLEIEDGLSGICIEQMHDTLLAGRRIKVALPQQRAE